MGLVTNIAALVFPSEIDTLEFLGAAGGQLVVRLTVDEQKLLDSVFYYDSSGRVKVEGLQDLVEPFLRDGVLHSLKISTNDGVAKSASILACSVENVDGAVEFCEECFLTLLSVAKTTYVGAKELVSLYLTSGQEMNISRSWLKDGVVFHDRATLMLPAGLQTVDVSPPAAAGQLLLDYDVRVGKRRLSFMLNHDMDSDPVSVLFRNAFGQVETFHFFGQVEKEVKPVRSSAIMGGRYVNYKIENVPSWKASTVLRLDGDVSLAEDLASALYAERVSDSCPIAITEVDLKPDNNRYGVVSMSATWREENRVRRFIPRHRVRVFDATFDATYE